MRDLDHIARFLRDDFGWDVDAVEEVGTGAWSTAYRFDGDGRDLVIRIGRHVEDFEADELAAGYRSRSLPIPDVVHLGRMADEYCCISSFAPGTPLEECTANEWATVVPSLVDALETMRSCRPERPPPTWNDTLLAADGDHAGTRLAGWRDEIVRFPEAVDALTRVMEQLEAIDTDCGLTRVEASLTHGDLINRNVHVHRGQISGIFDWGCLRWGDHLYDLAWFEFWSPWYPDLDIGMLRAELDRRWHDDGYELEHRSERERACLLHISADHLIYNSVIDSASGLEELLARMSDLDMI